MRHALSIAIFSVLLLTLTSFQRHAPRFDEMYECHIITDAEVTLYGEDDFEQIDSEEIMAAIAHGRRVGVTFRPRYLVHLFDDDGIRYKLYISKSGFYVSVDSNTFKLSRFRRNQLLRLLPTV